MRLTKPPPRRQGRVQRRGRGLCRDLHRGRRRGRHVTRDLRRICAPSRVVRRWLTGATTEFSGIDACCIPSTQPATVRRAAPTPVTGCTGRGRRTATATTPASRGRHGRRWHRRTTTRRTAAWWSVSLTTHTRRRARQLAPSVGRRTRRVYTSTAPHTVRTCRPTATCTAREGAPPTGTARPTVGTTTTTRRGTRARRSTAMWQHRRCRSRRRRTTW